MSGRNKSINPIFILGLGLLFFLAIAILLSVRLTVTPKKITSPQAKEEKQQIKNKLVKAAGNRSDISFDGEGRTVSETSSEKPGEILSGGVVIEDSRPEKESLRYYIIELNTPPLTKIRKEMKDKKSPQGEIARATKQHKNRIREEKDKIVSQMEKNIGKKIVKDKPKENQRRLKFDYDTAFNGLALELTSKEAEAVSAMDEVRMVYEDQPVQASLDVSVPMVKAPNVWPLVDTKGAPMTGYGIKIGIIDTGVDYKHPDLGGCLGPGCKVEGGWDFINSDSDPMDDHGHGTHVAATAAGNGAGNNLLLGVAPDATVYAYKVLSAGGSGSSAGVTAAIDRCPDPDRDGDLSNHLDVCSLSLGGPGNPDYPSSRASDNAMENDVLITVAAGNSGPGAQTIGSPGTSRLAITVGAACKTGACSSPLASFSSRGPVVWVDANGMQQTMVKPDIVAPGVNICAAEWGSAWADRRCMDDRHVVISGTSMATPHVAGVVALIKQAVPVATTSDIKAALKNSAIPFSGLDENAQGKGMVDTLAAIKFLNPNLNFSYSVYSKPSSLGITTDITQMKYSKDYSTTVFNNTSSPITVSLSSVSLTKGFSVSFPASSITVPANGSAPLAFSAAFDHSVLVSNTTNFEKLELAWSGGQLIIPLIIKVPNRITLPEEVNFGVDIPTNPGTFVSEKQVTVSNVMSAPAAYTISSDCCYNVSGERITSGINLSLSSSSLQLPAGGSGSLNAALSVNNDIVPNDIYSGRIIFSSPLQKDVAVPFRVYKYYSLVVAYPEDFHPHNLFVYDENRKILSASSGNGYTTVPYGSVQFLLGSLDSPYLDIMGIFYESPSPSNSDERFVVKEKYYFKGDDKVFLDPYSAKNEIVNNFTGLYGENLSDPVYKSNFLSQVPSLKLNVNQFPTHMAGYGNYSPIKFYVNDISDRYTYSHGLIYVYPSLGDGEIGKALLFENIITGGINSNRTFSNTSSDLKYLPVFGHSGTLDDPLYLDINFCLFHWGVQSCKGLAKLNKLGSAHNFQYDLYYLPTDVSLSAVRNYVYPKMYLYNSSKMMVMGTDLLMHKDGLKRYKGEGYNVPANSGRLDLGVLPLHYRTDWIISPEKKIIGGYLNGTYMGQEGDQVRFNTTGDVRPVTYNIYRNGQKIATGLSGDHIDVSGVMGNIAGTYDWELTDIAHIQGVSTNHSLKATFNLPADYESNYAKYSLEPPTMEEIRFTADGISSEVVEPGKNHVLSFRLNPGGTALDSISSLSVRQKADNSSWTSLQYSNTSAGSYTVDVPVVQTASLYAFEIVATDSYGNKLTYTFQLPKGYVPVPEVSAANQIHAGDMDANAVSCSGSGNGSFRATVEVHDINHLPVSGASVSGYWQMGSSDTVSACTTDANGRCEVSTNTSCSSRVWSMFYKIQSISKGGFMYNSYMNHDADGDSDGTTISMSVPVPPGLHISDLDGWSLPYSSTQWIAKLRVAVHDTNHQPVPNAKVYYTDQYNKGSYISTGSDGTGVQWDDLSRYDIAANPNIRYSVTDIIKSGYSYNKTVNHDDEGDSNGTLISVNYSTLSVTPGGNSPTPTPTLKPVVSAVPTLYPTSVPTYTPVPPTKVPSSTPTRIPSLTPTRIPTATNTPTPSGDNTPPVITILNPAADSIVQAKGTLKIEASAYDGSGIFDISISLDGQQVKSCPLVSACSYNQNLSKLKTGEHTVSVTAKDNSLLRNVSSRTIRFYR